MRIYQLTVAIVAASLCALTATALLADEIQSPATAPSASTDANYNQGGWQTVLPCQDIQGVLGKEAHSSQGENLGQIVDVLVDQGGQVRAAVIDFGGFLGVGSRRIVVDWAALHFAPGDQPDRVTLDLTRDQVRVAPEYKAGKPVVVLGGQASDVPEM